MELKPDTEEIFREHNSIYITSEAQKKRVSQLQACCDIFNELEGLRGFEYFVAYMPGFIKENGKIKVDHTIISKLG